MQWIVHIPSVIFCNNLSFSANAIEGALEKVYSSGRVTIFYMAMGGHCMCHSIVYSKNNRTGGKMNEGCKKGST